MKQLKNKTPAEIFYSVILGIIAFWGNKLSFLNPPKKKTIILCYHSISDSGWRFAVPPDIFYRQIKYAKDTAGIITLEEALTGAKSGVAITFDDGYADIFENALPVLEKLEAGAALFAIGEGGMADRAELKNCYPLLEKDQIAGLEKKGWIIGYHTRTHPDLRKAGKEKLSDEIIEGKNNLEKRLGIKINYFAYPRGIYSERIIESVKQAGFRAAFTVNGGNATLKNPYLISRVSMEGFVGMEEFKAMLSPIGLRFTSFYSRLLRIKERIAADFNIKRIKKEYIFTAIFLVFCALIFSLALRGLPGNPASRELNWSQWKDIGPFESSNERGRFALTYSVVEDKTVYFSEEIARFASPDLAMTSAGKYVSLFAPATAFLIIPGYVLGKYFGLSQLGAFAVIALFAFLNIILVRSIAIRLKADGTAAAIGALAFIFATPAFTYAVTLSQHHISTFIVLLGIYALLRWNNYWSLALIWFLTVFSATVDNPNIFLMLPVALCALGKVVIIRNKENNFYFKLRLLGFLSLLAIIFPLVFFLWFNSASNGAPLRISGTLKRITEIDKKSPNIQAEVEEKMAQENKIESKDKENVFGFFSTRNLTNGFYVHFLSPDRGIINYAPIILIGVLGLYFLYKENTHYANLLAAIIGLNVLVYSMWGDPYGGWAFGSRYLIPSYAMLAIGIGVILTRWRKNILFLIIFAVIFSYSAALNTLGALTTNANPPRIEILELEKIIGKEQKYTYERNWQYLEEKGLKSFVFQAYLDDKISARNYYYFIYALIVAAGVILLSSLKFSDFKFGQVLAIIKESKYVQRSGFKIKR